MLSSCPSDWLWKRPRLHLGSCVPEKITSIMHHQEKMWKERGYFCLLFYFKCDLNLSQETLLSSTAHLTSFTKLLTTQKLRLDLEGTHKVQQPTLAQKEGLCQSAQHFQNCWLKSLPRSLPGVKHPRVRDFQKEWLHRLHILVITAMPFFRATLSICTCHNSKGQWPGAVGFMFRRVSLQYLLRSRSCSHTAACFLFSHWAPPAFLTALKGNALKNVFVGFRSDTLHIATVVELGEQN